MVKERLTKTRDDRRTLPDVPDPERIRTSVDRRIAQDKFKDEETALDLKLLNLRYISEFAVRIEKNDAKGKRIYRGKSEDISISGMAVELDDTHLFEPGDTVKMRFTIPPGAMPEGFESTATVYATVARLFVKTEEGVERHFVAFHFEQLLTEYLQRKRWGYSVFLASAFLLFVSLVVILMRAESFIYFKYNQFLYFYSIIAATFLLSRYYFGALYRNVPINPDYRPGVSIIIPCFNEVEWIHRTILSCMNQSYPIDRLEVIVVDDCSNDGTQEKIEEVAELIYAEGARFKTKERLQLHFFKENKGKRDALVEGVALAKHDLVVFVDSDSFLQPDAITHLVQPFQDPKMGGVAGRTDVENKYTNWLTKLQTVRYYVAFRIMKAAEAWFDSVTCLSGPLSCYRKELILQHQDAWLNQRFLGQPATFGDDRSMTNYILKTHRTSYQDRAICSTIVPSKFSVLLSQQMRWKRSWLRESLRALGFIWKKEPFMALFFLVGLIVPIAAPIVVVYNLIYVPLAYKIFPTTFLMGLLLMAMLMSFAHLFFRKSKMWVFGFVFCLFYEFILLWQMPIAWVTFWKSTWGTRETPQDIEAREKKEERKNRRKRLKEKVAKGEGEG